MKSKTCCLLGLILIVVSVLTVANLVYAVSVTATITVGNEPTGMAYDSAKGEIFVVNHAQNSVSVVSDGTNAVVSTISVGSGPYKVVYDSSKGEVFVVNEVANTVSVISDNTNSVIATVTVGTQPTGAAFDSAKGEIFVTNSLNATVSVISDSTNTVIKTINVGLGPINAAYDSAKGEVFVVDYAQNAVSVVSDSTNAVVATVNVGTSPAYAAYDSGKGEVFVVNEGGNFVSVISDNSNAVTRTINVGTTPYGAAYDSGTGEIYVINHADNSVSVISDTDYTVVATVTVGTSPYGAVYDSAKGEIFISNAGYNTVSVISDSSGTSTSSSPTTSVTPSTTSTLSSSPATSTSPTSATSPTISSVNTIAATPTQTITIQGNGFGNTQPQTLTLSDGSVDTVGGGTGLPGSGGTPVIQFNDITNGWGAGYRISPSTGYDLIGINLVKWSNTQIVIGGFGSQLNSTGQFNINTGDSIQIIVITPGGTTQYTTTVGSSTPTPTSSPSLLQQVWVPKPTNTALAVGVTTAAVAAVSVIFALISNPLGAAGGKASEKTKGLIPDNIKDWLSEVVSSRREIHVETKAGSLFKPTKLEVIAYTTATIVLAVSFSYVKVITLNQIWELLPVFFLTSVLVGFVQKFISISYLRSKGVWSEHKIWPLGLLLFLFTTFAFKVPFSSPTRSAHEEKKLTDRLGAIASVIEIIVSLGFAAFFFLLLIAGFPAVGGAGLDMCVIGSFFGTFPISPMSGKDIFNHNKRLWATLFIVTLIIFVAWLLLI
ncbi:MAG TPA: YncE family protein [Candidatus Nanoarchaeia archaeon]|nr:YncE family protein [Candidatus Nanoarchaeia archaeon]